MFIRFNDRLVNMNHVDSINKEKEGITDEKTGKPIYAIFFNRRDAYIIYYEEFEKKELMENRFKKLEELLINHY